MDERIALQGAASPQSGESGMRSEIQLTLLPDEEAEEAEEKSKVPGFDLTQNPAAATPKSELHGRGFLLLRRHPKRKTCELR